MRPLGKGPLVVQALGAEAAIDGQAGTGDVARFRAGEVGDEASDFFAGAVAGQGHQRFQGFGEFALRRVHVGVHRAGLDVVDGDALRAEVAGHAFGQADQR